jgi:hypothetical protein
MQVHRPPGVTVLAIFEILFGAIGFIAGVVIIGLPTLVSTLPKIGALLNSLGLIIGVGVLCFSLIWLATGIGFLWGRSWGRTIGMIFNAISMLGAVGAVASGLITGGIGAIIFWSYMIYYLNRTHVKKFFGEGASGVSPSLHLPYPEMTPLSPQQNTTLLTGNGSNHPSRAGSLGSKSLISCPNCGSRLAIGSPKCLSCGAAL